MSSSTIVDPYVQEWVAATNGRLYVPLVRKLGSYPIPECPLPPARGELLLDIGCGWGRWMVSARRKGYLPIGIDVKLDALQAARRVMRALNVQGYVVVADLEKLPFKAQTFDIVFSYSVIQHVHRQRAYRFVEEMHRVLKNGGSCKLQFPIKHGVGNFLRRTSQNTNGEDNYDSWCVRYYSIAELRALFGRVFANFAYQPDCYLGIGVQRSDISILPWRYKPIVVCSEALKGLSRVLPVLRRLADSVYVLAGKNVGSDRHDYVDVVSPWSMNKDESNESNRLRGRNLLLWVRRTLMV